MKKLFIGNLPSSTNEAEITELFSQYGKVRSIKLATDIFTNKCKGFGFIEMEGHEARAAIAGLNGKFIDGKALRVNYEEPKTKRGRR
jgi:RNA recognition motif-containing protein